MIKIFKDGELILAVSNKLYEISTGRDRIDLDRRDGTMFNEIAGFNPMPLSKGYTYKIETM